MLHTRFTFFSYDKFSENYDFISLLKFTQKHIGHNDEQTITPLLKPNAHIRASFTFFAANNDTVRICTLYITSMTCLRSELVKTTLAVQQHLIYYEQCQAFNPL